MSMLEINVKEITEMNNNLTALLDAVNRLSDLMASAEKETKSAKHLKKQMQETKQTASNVIDINTAKPVEANAEEPEENPMPSKQYKLQQFRSQMRETNANALPLDLWEAWAKRAIQKLSCSSGIPSNYILRGMVDTVNKAIHVNMNTRLHFANKGTDQPISMIDLFATERSANDGSKEMLTHLIVESEIAVLGSFVCAARVPRKARAAAKQAHKGVVAA